MNMMKSLFLGSAAGLLAVAGAQAADLPVKAKAVEYVKVCSLYGAGFWYVPGTDTCLKIGSYIRTQISWGAEGGGIPIGAGSSDTSGRNTRIDTSDVGFRSRQALSVDLRTQTEYGTLRSYLEVGAQVTTSSNASAGTNAATGDAVFVDRGFVQFAGFTVGRTRSFFDINSMAPYSYANSRISGDTGAAGITVWTYTAQLGNGVSASLGFEDGGSSSGGRGRSVTNLNATTNTTAFTGAAGGVTNAGSSGAWTLGGTATDNRGSTFPDVVGALRIDQAWGYAQVAAALHDVSGGYYTSGTGSLAGAQNNGHPSDKIGYAITGGFTLNNVLGMKGDTFGMQVAYTVGAAGYATRATGAWLQYGAQGSTSLGVGWLSEGVFTTTGASNIELTEVWGINGAYQHMWNPKWRTSLYGGYNEVNYNNNAKAMVCPAGVGVAQSAVGPTATGTNGFTGAVSNCNPDYSWWQVGTRTQWNPHPDLDIGVDVLYTKLNTAFKGTTTIPSQGGRPAGAATIDDQDVLSVLFRVQRNFLP